MTNFVDGIMFFHDKFTYENKQSKDVKIHFRTFLVMVSVNIEKILELHGV